MQIKPLRLITVVASAGVVALVTVLATAEFAESFEPRSYTAPTRAYERALSDAPGTFRIDELRDAAPLDLFVQDDEALFRPRAGYLDPESGARTIGYGFWRDDEIAGELPGARILWIGDELVGGQLPNPVTAPTLIEDALRSGDEPESPYADATVIDASSPGYSLYQLALRARGLEEVLAPHLTVVVLNAGNDVVELVDETRPHIDMRGFEADPVRGAPTTLRDNLESKLGGLRPGVYQATFYQSGWLHLQKHRHEDLDRRMRKSLAAIRRAVPGPLLIAFVPPWDVLTGTAPGDALAADAEPADPAFLRAVAESDLQSAWTQRVLGLLRRAGLPHVDLGPHLTDPAAWTPRGRLSRQGHRRIAEVLAPRIRQILEASY